MRVDLTIDDKLLRLKIKAMVALVPKKINLALLKTAQKGVTILKKRTAKGVGFDEKPFADYSAKYALFRKSRGRKTSPVDLNFSGRMLGSIAARRSGNNLALIYFTRATESKKAAMIQNNDKKPRLFWGFSDPEKKQLSNAFKKYIKS